MPSSRPVRCESRIAKEAGPSRRSDQSPATPPSAPPGPECTEYRADVRHHWPWESTRAAGAGAGTSSPSAPAAVFPATRPARVPRCARNAPHPPPVRRGWHGNVGKLRGGHPCGTPCPTGCRSGQPVRSWLSSAMRSVASEPNQARWVDSRQSLGSCHFPSYVLKQGAFAPPALPGFVTTTPPSAIRAADSIPHEIIVARLPARHHHGLPLLHGRSLPCVLPPLPRWNPRMHLTLASPTASAFLVIVASRLPRRRFEACSVFIRIAARRAR